MGDKIFGVRGWPLDAVKAVGDVLFGVGVFYLVEGVQKSEWWFSNFFSRLVLYPNRSSNVRIPREK